MKKCNINSIETLGLKDGPGIRTVIFLQGCNLRCKYCHNPEMWNKDIKKEYTVNELMNIIKRYKPYYKDNGGITISGGEPLLQSDFLIDLFKKCHEEGIHTCIDTAGAGCTNYDILKHTDLILLDIKHVDEDEYKSITGHDMNDVISFINACNINQNKLWLRQVITPGINDNIEYIKDLTNYIKDIDNVERIDLLPYHSMAKEKYKELNIKYILDDTPDMDIYKLNLLNEELQKEDK